MNALQNLSVQPVTLYWFSPTGNTYQIACAMRDGFTEKGYPTTLVKITKDGAPAVLPKGLIGLVFPVAIQSTFPIIWDFVNTLPNGQGRSIFMADTMEAFSGGVVGPMKKLLTQKGYHCMGAMEFKMASSMQTDIKKQEEGRIKSETSLAACKAYVDALVDGTAKWGRVPVLSDLMYSISKGRGIWTQTSEKIQPDSAQCIGCKRCENHCPLGVISVQKNTDKTAANQFQVTIDHQKCIACMRCVNYCPKNLFSLGGKVVFQKQAAAIDVL